jgi:hypothetical protein
MGGWRHPLSHLISPKLIYTTASRRRNGFAAFIVDDEWYVNLHGGTSQQFNYTGLEFVSRTSRADHVPNNLADPGIELYLRFRAVDAPSDTILYYIAGIWNSELAADLLDAGTSSRPRIKLPEGDAESRLALDIAGNARRARDLSRLIHHLPESKPEVQADLFRPWAPESMLTELGIELAIEERPRFRPREFYKLPAGAIRDAQVRLSALEAEINELVELLYE